MRTFNKLLCTIVLCSFILAACGGPATTAPPATEKPPEPTAVSPEKPTEAPLAPTTPPSATTKEAVLRIGWGSEPDTMNPLTTYSTEATEIIRLVYDKLLEFGLDLKTEPSLAKEFAYSTDGLTITYKLRENVKWHDGKPFTADDVVFTFQFIKDNSFGAFAQWLINMTEVKATDANTVVVIFNKPQAFNPGLIIPILPKHLWSTMTAKDVETFPNDAPVGTGPFRFVEWKKGATLTLNANPDFWGGVPKASKIIYVLYSNEDVMAQALKGGEIDIVTEVPPTIWEGLTNVENVKAASMPSFSLHHIGFNVSDNANSKGNPLLKEKIIRQALNYAVDRNQLVQIALAGHGRPGDSIIPIGLTEWYLPIPADKQMNANPEKAKEVLENAGYKDSNNDGVRESPDGKPLEFRLIAIETTSVDVRAGQLFKDAAEAVGIKLDLQTLDENTLGNTVYNSDAPDWDIFVWGWDSEPDPDSMLGVVLCSQIGGNSDVFYCDKTYDEMFDKQATTVDYTARKAIVDQMQLKFYDEAVYIVMWYQDKLQAYRTDTWTGWQEVPGGILYNVTRANYLNVAPAK